MPAAAGLCACDAYRPAAAVSQDRTPGLRATRARHRPEPALVQVMETTATTDLRAQEVLPLLPKPIESQPATDPLTT